MILTKESGNLGIWVPLKRSIACLTSVIISEMQVSNDFLLRTIGAQDGIIMPVDKKAARDYLCEIVLKRIGRQQTFLDISRCGLLSAHFSNFTVPNLCPNLVYLDISYTACDDLDVIFTRCKQLKALNVAGVRAMHPSLSGISVLTELEYFCMRSSNIVDISDLASCLVLRSLDFGHCTVRDLCSTLRSHDRLEELLLDNCKAFRGSGELEVKVMHLPSLRLLNVCEGDFPAHWFTASATVSRVYEEPSARRQQLLAAVIQDDAKEMHRLLTSGQDIAMRASLSDQPFLTKTWSDRCTLPKYKLQTPFLLCHEGIPVDRRPCALHLAIFFNAVSCLQTLVDMNADKEALTFIADVKLSADQNSLEENGSEEGTVLRRREVNALQLLEATFERKVHRLTENMISKKTPNWKGQCTKIRNRLSAVLEYGSQLKKNLRNQLDADMRRSSSTSPKKGRKQQVETLEDVDADDGSIHSQAHSAASWDDASSVGDMADMEPTGTFVNSPSAIGSPISSPAKPSGPKRPTILPKKEMPFSWRDHGMVQALVGPARIIRINEKVVVTVEAPSTKGSWMAAEKPKNRRLSNVPSARTLNKSLSIPVQPIAEQTVQYTLTEFSVLGKKSFWMESRAQAIKAREEGSGGSSGNSKTAHNLGVYGNLHGFLKQADHVYPRERDLEEDWLAGRRGADIPSRRKNFMAAVRERMEKKFNEHIS